jgi:hypothetical protein
LQALFGAGTDAGFASADFSGKGGRSVVGKGGVTLGSALAKGAGAGAVTDLAATMFLGDEFH